MKSPDDVGVKSELVVYCGDLSARDEGVGCRDIRNQDVNSANLLENGRDAVKVGDGCGVRGDPGVGILGFEFLLRFAENLLTSLDEDEMMDAGFGERLCDGEADATCLEELVAVQQSLRRSHKPPPVISTVLSFPSNVLDGEMRS